MAGVPFNALSAPNASEPQPVLAAVNPNGLAKLRDMKATAPNAAGMSDAQFAVASHQHYYSDLPIADYLAKVGLDRGDVLFELRAPGDPYGDYLREALATPGAGETPEQAAVRQGGQLEVRRADGLEGAARAYLQGGAFGFVDEVVAAGAAALDPLVHGDRGKDFGERFNAYLGREQQLVDNFRTDNPLVAYGAEIAGALPTSAVAGGQLAARGGSTMARMGSGAAVGAGQGAVYGFGSTDGDLEERGTGAAVGAGMGLVVGGALPAVIDGAAGLIQKGVRKASVKDAIAGAPSAAAIRQQSKAGYRAAEGTGAVIERPALNILNHDVRAFAQQEGLLLPSGQVAEGYPKFSGALRTIEEFSQGPINMKQAQTVQKSLRRVAKSTDPEEARLGVMMLDQFEDFMDSLPPSAFSGGDGTAAMQHWTKARSDWARFRRTETIESLIEDAQLHDGGFAVGLRSGFKRILKKRKRQQGFSAADMQAIRAFVDGGPVDALLKHIGGGGTIPAAVTGHVFGGPVGAALATGAKMVGGGMARGARNSGARRAAEAIRAGVATPGGIAVPPGLSPGQSAIFRELSARGVGAQAPVLDEPRSAVAAALMKRGGR